VNELNQDLDRIRNKIVTMDANHSNAVKELQQEIVARDQTIKSACQQMSALQKNLDDCKETIFDLQGAQSVSDGEIDTAYENLFQTIETWTTDTFADTDDALRTAVATMQSKDVDYDMESYVSEKHLDLAANYPLLDSVLLTSFFTKPIYTKLLDPLRICPGLSDNENNLLNFVLIGMTKVTPRKGKISSLCTRTN
jgi:hypothetical protein